MLAWGALPSLRLRQLLGCLLLLQVLSCCAYPATAGLLESGSRVGQNLGLPQELSSSCNPQDDPCCYPEDQVCGWVALDVQKDGMYNPDEDPGVADVQLWLWTPTAGFLGRTSTSSRGAFCFNRREAAAVTVVINTTATRASTDISFTSLGFTPMAHLPARKLSDPRANGTALDVVFLLQVVPDAGRAGALVAKTVQVPGKYCHSVPQSCSSPLGAPPPPTPGPRNAKHRHPPPRMPPPVKRPKLVKVKRALPSIGAVAPAPSCQQSTCNAK